MPLVTLIVKETNRQIPISDESRCHLLAASQEVPGLAAWVFVVVIPCLQTREAALAREMCPRFANQGLIQLTFRLVDRLRAEA